jgi:anion-transporting  ArsA/GET3 family ATPase
MSAPPPDLNELLRSRRVLLCVGCGGVGKTTSCAALGLAAARLGKRALCLTIDPARRLAESLGLERVCTEAQRIDPDVLAAVGVEHGSLTVMMLDTKRTFDALVAALAKTEARRDAILDNPLYRYISTQLAGSQEYMAMEKLYAVKDDPAYDLVLLDTPPTSHALDFLDAPERLVGAFDSAAVRWFVQAMTRSGRFSLDLLQRTAARVLRGLGRITGGGFLEQVASFLAGINDLFGGWRQRAEKVSAALRGPEVGYVLVTTPEPMCIREVLFFAERLRAQGMHPDAFVVNRVHPLVPGASAEDIAREIARRGLGIETAADRVARAAGEERRLGELDRLHLVALDEVRDGRTPIVTVPELPRDIHDPERLAWVADVLAPVAERTRDLPARAASSRAR